MAQKDSPVKRRMRRLKRENSLLNRFAASNAKAYAEARLFLLAVLAQSGGEKVVTASTLKQIVNMSNMTVRAYRNAEDTELTIRLVDGTPVAPEKQLPPEGITGSVDISQPSIESNEL